MQKIVLIAAVTLAAGFAGVRVNVHIGVGHPIHRVMPQVVVREGRAPIIVRERASFIAPILFRSDVVVIPGRERIVWGDSEKLLRDEEWVDSTLTVNSRGRELFLRVTGRAQIQFAEIHFGNGQVQVVDFDDKQMQEGTFRLLDFTDGRLVKGVRLIARARTPEAKLSVLMAK